MLVWYILLDIETDPEISVRRTAVMYPQIGPISVYSIMHKETLYPFHIQKIHAMVQRDFVARGQSSQ